MARKRLQPEEIILKLREVEIQQGKGYVSITPLNYDWTDYSFAKGLKQFISKPGKVCLHKSSRKV